MFRLWPDVKENLCLFAQANRNGIDKHERGAAISYCLTNLCTRQRLQLTRVTTDQDNGLGVANIAMSRQRSAEMLEKASQTERVSSRVILSADQFGGEPVQNMERF